MNKTGPAMALPAAGLAHPGGSLRPESGLICADLVHVHLLRAGSRMAAIHGDKVEYIGLALKRSFLICFVRKTNVRRPPAGPRRTARWTPEENQWPKDSRRSTPCAVSRSPPGI